MTATPVDHAAAGRWQLTSPDQPTDWAEVLVSGGASTAARRRCPLVVLLDVQAGRHSTGSAVPATLARYCPLRRRP